MVFEKGRINPNPTEKEKKKKSLLEGVIVRIPFFFLSDKTRFEAV